MLQFSLIFQPRLSCYKLESGVCVAKAESKKTLQASFFFMPEEGIEPSSPYGHASLSRARLPVPPLRLVSLNAEGIRLNIDPLAGLCQV